MTRKDGRTDSETNVIGRPRENKPCARCGCDMPKALRKKYCSGQCAVKTKACKGCEGTVRTSLKKNYCSDECRIRNFEKNRDSRTVIANCCVCGVDVVREYKREQYCCSDRCQKTWAALARIDWSERSRKAKEIYRKQRRRQRRLGSNMHQWDVVMKAQIRVAFSRFPIETWKAKFNCIVTSNKHRESLSSKRYCVAKSTGKDWHSCLTKLVKEVLKNTERLWIEKLSNVAGNQRARMQRKSLAQTLQNSKIDNTEDATTAELN